MTITQDPGASTATQCYRSTLIPQSSPMIRVSPEEIKDLHGANENSPRRTEIKVRKNEMKLRKNEIASPKNFSTPRWILGNPYRAIRNFLHRDLDELTLDYALALTRTPIQ